METEKNFSVFYNEIKNAYEGFKASLENITLPDKFYGIREKFLECKFKDIKDTQILLIKEGEELTKENKEFLKEIYRHVKYVETLNCLDIAKQLSTYIKENVRDEKGFVNNSFAICSRCLERLQDELWWITKDIEELFLGLDQLQILLYLEQPVENQTEEKSQMLICEMLNKNQLSGFLIKAIEYRCDDSIDYLLKIGADPFYTGGLTTSAFSTAFQEEREDIAQNFVTWKLNKSPKDSAIYQSLTQDFEDGNFAYYIASHICKQDEPLKEFLFGDDISAIRNSYLDAISCCKLMGSYDDDLVAENDYL